MINSWLQFDFYSQIVQNNRHNDNADEQIIISESSIALNPFPQLKH